MRTIYHLWLSAGSRKIRLTMAVKALAFDSKIEKTWERRAEFLHLNPAGEVPVLVEEDGTTLCGSQVIAEYLEEVYPDRPMIWGNVRDKAEIRRLTAWFDDKFNLEVTENLVGEKLTKRLSRQGEPFGPAIRAGLANIHHHLDYIGWLAERRRWLGGEYFSLADITAAAHLSCVDYLGDVPWDDHREARDWYARVKSRPCFRPLLDDVVPGIPAAKHYGDLDF